VLHQLGKVGHDDIRAVFLQCGAMDLRRLGEYTV